jgi:cell division protein FtsB
MAGLLLAWLSFGHNGLVDLFSMQKDREKNMTALQELKAKNRHLASEIRHLREDSNYFESVARKELGLVRENEIVYRIKGGEKGTIKRPIQEQ